MVCNIIRRALKDAVPNKHLGAERANKEIESRKGQEREATQLAQASKPSRNDGNSMQSEMSQSPT